MLRISCLMLALVFGEFAFASEFTFVWTPHSQDIEKAGTPSFRELQAVLEYVDTQQYCVKPHDNLDFIIRKMFLVSASYQNAYSLYLRRILELNPSLSRNGILQVNQKLTLPVGPKFAATELGDQRLPQRLHRAVFTDLTVSAYSARSARSGFVIATRDLARYVNPKADIAANNVLQTIINRGIVSASAVGKKLSDSLTMIQTYNVTIPPGQEKTGSVNLRAVKGDLLFPRFVPMATPASVPCSGCTACKDLLQIPPYTDLSHARLLIEDTGVNAQVDPSKIVPNGVTNVHDDSPDSHGTFVFSEIAAPSQGFVSGKGLLPSADVYVAKAAHRISDGTFQFAMKDIIDAWQSFGVNTLKDSNAATTIVVNISAEGPAPVDTTAPDGSSPQLPGGDRMLVVAAAGNSANDIGPVDELFGELSSEHAALLIVGSTAIGGGLASYSNWHPTHVQLFAQGDCVCGSPGQINGTSQAAPIVATAAAILASDRPNWNAHQVKWRLISSADVDPRLNGSNFGLVGKVNLFRALAKGISIVVNNQSAPIIASSITFDVSWSSGLKTATVTPSFPIIKLYKSSPSPRYDGNFCFAALMFENFTTQQVCVPPSASVDVLDDSGQSRTLKASDILDIALPLFTDRDPNVTLPTIAFLRDGVPSQ